MVLISYKKTLKKKVFKKECKNIQKRMKIFKKE